MQKSPRSEANFTCSETSTAKETNRKLLRPSTKTKRRPFFFNSATPIQLRFKELCDGFYTILRSPSQRVSVTRSVLSSTAPAFTGANIGSISRCAFQICHDNVKIVQNERKRRLLSTAMRTIDFEVIFVKCPVLN